MDSIFFESQSGNLCAQHCLNALLQGAVFTAVDLAEIAARLDERERQVGAVGAGTSHNMDDSGYFSVQVMGEALKVWDIELVPLGNPRVKYIADNPTERSRAFVCNMREHWFTVRKLAKQWFNLNSVQSGARLISDTYLRLYLAQLQAEGYTVFAVLGPLPQCAADEALARNPALPDTAGGNAKAAGGKEKKGPELWAGRGQTTGGQSTSAAPLDDNAQLEEAIRLSLAVSNGRPAPMPPPPPAAAATQQEDVRARRQAFLDKLAKG